jgi:dihydroflavonol-4-reductase
LAIVRQNADIPELNRRPLKMRILLTGATGLLGNNLLRMLLDDGHELTVTHRQNSDLRPFDGLSVERIVCDLANPGEIVAALDGMDWLIHSAALIQLGWTRLDTSRRINVEATRQLAQAARLKDVRMIHVSTVDAMAAAHDMTPACESDVDPSKPPCTYVVTKREAEREFLEQMNLGLQGILVNPGLMFGPWDWKPSSGQMILAVGRQFTPLAPRGGISVVDVRDVASGIIAALEFGRPGERYILAGENTSYFDLWVRIARITGSRPPIGKLPQWVNWSAGKVGDWISRFFEQESIVNSAATQMGTLRHWYSSEKAKQELGYNVGDVDNALADAWEWFRTFNYV